jgi:outer membrane protein OmpA-like peptidoglycan-associated protein
MIKNVLSVILFTVLSLSVQAQSVGFRLNNYSYKQGTNMTDRLVQGAEIGFYKRLGKVFDLYVPLRLGPRGDVELTENAVTTKTTLLGNLGVDANLLAKFDNGHNRLVPFATAGVGTELYDSGLELGAPVGVGLNVRIKPNVFITLASNYRLPLTKTTPVGFVHSLGVTIDLGKKEKAPSTYNSEQNFNETKLAAAKLKAAEEAIAKEEAEAKAEAEAKMKAQLATEEANKAQSEKEKRDKLAADEKAKADAKADSLYRATLEEKPVVVSAEIKKVLDFALEHVQFELGSALLTSASYPNLDDVANTMKANSELRISIEGHTDRTGNEGINSKLSEARARTCMTYLISKGIAAERLRVIGYGSIRPVSDNETEAGRSRNRRVEFVPF